MNPQAEIRPNRVRIFFVIIYEGNVSVRKFVACVPDPGTWARKWGTQGDLMAKSLSQADPIHRDVRVFYPEHPSIKSPNRYPISTTTSISIKAPSGSPATCTVERAGLWPAKAAS